MQSHRISAVIVTLALALGLAIPAAAVEGAVLTGAYSDQWEAGLDLRNWGVVGESPITLGGTFHHPDEGRENTLHILEEVWRAEATPVANLEIFASSAQVANGSMDPVITEWASSVQTWLGRGEGRSLLIAPMAEMNGSWVPWGMDPVTYPDAFRRVVTIFRDMGMDETQVRFIWAPNSVSSWPHGITAYWPGGDVVDMVGFSAYNFGGDPENWATAHDALFEASQIIRAVARDKPFLITQIGSGPEGGEKDDWIVEMVDFIANDPNMVGFVYFNFDKERNWKVWDGFEVSQGWQQAMQHPDITHQWPLTDWFQPGPIPFGKADEPAVPAPVAPEPGPPVKLGPPPQFIGAQFVGGEYIGLSKSPVSIPE